MNDFLKGFVKFQKEWSQAKEAGLTLTPTIIGYEHFCLFSGRCCTVQEFTGVPGYEDGIKPAGTVCKHLKLAKKNEQGQWEPAACGLHGTSEYPQDCSGFVVSPGPCFLGKELWQRRLKQEGGEPPVQIKNFVAEGKEEKEEE